MYVLLVFQDVRFARQHGIRWRVVGANIHHGKSTTGLQQAVGFSQDTFTTSLGGLVEGVHDSDQIKRLSVEASVFGIASSIDWSRGTTAPHLGRTVLEKGHDGFDQTQVLGQKVGHGNHFLRRVKTHDLFGIGEGVTERPSGDTNTAAHIEDFGTGILGVAREPFR